MKYEVQINMTEGNYKSNEIANVVPLGSMQWGLGDNLPPLKIIEVDDSDFPQRIKNLPPKHWAMILQRDYRFKNNKFLIRPQSDLSNRRRPGDLHQ